MIVQCPQCRARFRVADEKVPDKGVKVRCTKCANVFKVTRADAVDGPAAKTPSPAGDPFGLDSAPPPARPKSPAFDLGLDAPPPPAAPRVLPNLPQAVSLTYGVPGSSPAFSSEQVAPAAPPPPAPPPAPAAPPAYADPFADMDFGGAAAAPAPSPAPAFAPPLAAPMLTPAPGADPFADLDFGMAAPAPVPYVAPAPAPRAPTPPPAASSDPFADDFGEAPPPAPPPRSAPTPAPKAPPLRSAPTPAPKPSLGDDDPFAVPAPAEVSDPFAGVEHSLGPKAAPAPFSEPTPGIPPEPPRAEGPRISHAGGTEIDFQETSVGPRLDLDLAGAGLPDRPREAADLGRIQLAKNAPEPAKQKPLDPAEAARLRVRREIATAIFNALSALVIGLTGLITIAAIRAPRPLTVDDIGFNIVWLAIGAAEERPADLLRATNVHTGTFVTRAGQEVFYVEGQAENLSSAPHEAVHVAVELRRGDEVLSHAESVASLGGDPEQLFELATGKNDELQRRLATGHGSVRLKPHAKAPFIAVFALSARDVEGSEVHLTLEDGIPPPLKPLFTTPEKPADDGTVGASTNGTGDVENALALPDAADAGSPAPDAGTDADAGSAVPAGKPSP